MSGGGGTIRAMTGSVRMSLPVARRVALAAQGFGGRAPARATRRVLATGVRRLGLLQLDSVNVAVRAHYMPLYARLGAYDRGTLDALAWPRTPAERRRRTMVEFWAHEASLLPIEDWPLLRWRMRDNTSRRSRWLAAALEHRPGLLDAVHDAVAAQGPLEAGQVEEVLGDGGTRQARAHGGWWQRSDVKVACEHLFAAGVLTTGTRVGFRRAYDVVERVLPPDVLATDPDRPDAVRELVRRSASMLGVATEPDLRDYYRLPPGECQAAVAELVDAGDLVPVAVDGWAAPAYRSVGARAPRRVEGRALLAPFDPLIWFRARTERLFDFHYRIEIYTPSHQRRHGYYVFPFLLDGDLAARVDLKADREAGVLRVPGAFAEDWVADDRRHETRVAAELAGALEEMAVWLGLDGVVVEGGPLAPALARAG